MLKAFTLALALSTISAAAAAEVTLINVFEVPGGQRDAVVAGWEKARDFLSEQPGYIETALHESISPESRFQLINVARWADPQSFQSAVQAMNKAGIFPRIEGLGINPALYTVIRTD
ncbi:MAG: antibiotic biosynthesis monooxygenase family protein [Alphaproteobacteria bacterium]|nr:antibiotic biosynthesis monooxygenase family protein [Alphaproteobacteria bacterium]